MTNLTAYKKDNIEYYIDNTTGEVFFSKSGYARMANVPKSTIATRGSSVQKSEVKTTEILTAAGLRSVRCSYDS